MRILTIAILILIALISAYLADIEPKSTEIIPCVDELKHDIVGSECILDVRTSMFELYSGVVLLCIFAIMYNAAMLLGEV